LRRSGEVLPRREFHALSDGGITTMGISAPPFSRRSFLAQASCFGAFYHLAARVPILGFSNALTDDSRISASPIIDKGFASVRKIGDGLYATISDASKGYVTVSNGGFLVGKDSALLLEGFASVGGAAFQMETLRSVTPVPVKAALDTHYHFDHSCGNAFYGAHGIELWGHSAVARRIYDAYAPMQSLDPHAVLAPQENRLRDAKNDVEKTHAQGDLNAMTGIYKTVNSTMLAFPDHPIAPERIPLTVDLGELSIIIESHPGHSGTDLIVRVPSQNVVYTGDLLFNGWYPVCFDQYATISGWRDSLKKFADYDKDTIFVPGHGQLCGQEGIATLRAVFDDISEQAEKMHKAGVPAKEAAERYVVPEKYKSFPIFAWGLTIEPAIIKLYSEWGVK
jgi:glyoxylase-like metal-dependent hydrolase (beta-lactamase superfamily II)